jgi:hypothetical protein
LRGEDRQALDRLPPIDSSIRIVEISRGTAICSSGEDAA